MDKVFELLAQEVIKQCTIEKVKPNVMEIIATFKDPVSKDHSKMICIFLSFLCCNHPNTFKDSKLIVNEVQLVRTVNGKRDHAIGLNLSEATTCEMIALSVYLKFIESYRLGK